MKRSTLKWISLVVIVFWLMGIIGCRYTPKYKVDTVEAMDAPQYPFRVAVCIIQHRQKQDRPISKSAAARMVAEHLRKANVFLDAQAVSEKFADLSSEHMAELKAKGFDTIFVGNIESFRASKTESPDAEALSTTGGVLVFIGPLTGGILSLLGFIMVLTANSMPGDVSALTTMGVEIKKHDGTVLWQGRSTGEVRRDLASISETRDETFKEAVDCVIERLKQASQEGKGATQKNIGGIGPD